MSGPVGFDVARSFCDLNVSFHQFQRPLPATPSGRNGSGRRGPGCLGQPPLRQLRLPDVIELVAVCSSVARQMRLETRSARLIVR